MSVIRIVGPGGGVIGRPLMVLVGAVVELEVAMMVPTEGLWSMPGPMAGGEEVASVHPFVVCG